jgi:hypothetical protein
MVHKCAWNARAGDWGGGRGCWLNNDFRLLLGSSKKWAKCGTVWELVGLCDVKTLDQMDCRQSSESFLNHVPVVESVGQSNVVD